MARGFDELIEHLLTDVALCGDEGARVQDFKDSVQKFYAEDGVTVDICLLKQVWQWLASHSDIAVEGDASDPELRYLDVKEAADVTTGDENAGNVLAAQGDQQELETDGRPNTLNGSNAPGPVNKTSNHSDIRVHTSQDRVWLALTGHGVDWGKVPRMEFELLSVIIRYREKGITQPELVRLTGQDKRSVPKRTSTLAEKGYIFKDTLAAHKTRTSLLVHRRFRREDVEATSAGVFKNGSLMLGKFWDYLFSVLQDQAVIGQKDLRRVFGIEKKRLENRKLWRAVKHLMKLGLVDIIKAKWEYQGKEMPYPIKSIKLLKTPTPMDREAFLYYKKQEEIGPAREAMEDDDPDEGEDDDSQGEGEMEETIVEDEVPVEVDLNLDFDIGNANAASRIAPQWSNTIPLNNFLFKVVDNAGKEGLNSGQLAKQSVGTTWTRPMEETISRLTDAWEASQPQHLRHLSLIRDTKSYGSSGVQYVWRSLAGQQQADDDKEASWEGISKTAAKSATAVMKAADRDVWGFPKPRTSQFVGPSGSASLSDCYRAAKIRIEQSAVDPELETKPDGTEVVVWPAWEEDSEDDGQGTKDSPKKKTPNPRLGRKPGGSMFDGVRTDSSEYQKLYREKRKEEQLNVVWEARARRLARWRAYNEVYPNGLPAAVSGTKRSASVADLGSPTPDAVVPRKRGRPPKKKQNKGKPQQAGEGSMTAAQRDSTSIAASGNEPPTADTSTQPDDQDSSRPLHTAELTPTAELSKEVIAKHLQDILSLNAPGAYYDVPATRRKDLPPSTPSTILLIKSKRLREINWGTEAVVSASHESEVQIVDAGDLPSAPAVQEQCEYLNDALIAAPVVEPTVDSTVPLQVNGGADQDVDQAVAPIVFPSPKTRRSVEVLRNGGSVHNGVDPPIDNDPSVLTGDIRSSSIKDILTQQPVHPAVRPSTPPAPSTARALPGPSQQTPGPTAEPDEDEQYIPSEAEDEEASDADPLSGAKPREQSKDVYGESPAQKTPKSKMRPKKGVTIGGGSVAHVRTSILMDMLDRCGGAIPGGDDIDQPFIAAFHARFPDAPKPDRPTIQRAVKNLYDQGKLKVFEFRLRSRNGKMHTKKIIALKSFDIKSAIFKSLQKKMQEAYPKPYLPELIWEPGTAAQARPRTLQPGQNSYSRIPLRDETVTVPILQPGEKQMNQARIAAEREEKRKAKEAAKVLKQEKEVARAAAAAERAERLAQNKEVKKARQLEREARQLVKHSMQPSLVDYQTPDLPAMQHNFRFVAQDGLWPSTLERETNYGDLAVQPLDFRMPTNVVEAQENGHGSTMSPSFYGPQDSHLLATYNGSGNFSSLAPRPPHLAHEDVIPGLSSPEAAQSTPDTTRRRRQRSGSDDNFDNADTQRGAKRQKLTKGYLTSPADGATPITSTAQMTSDQMNMLLHAHVSARVLAAGLEGAVNWYIIDYIFRDDPYYSKQIFKSKWNTMTKGKAALMDSLVLDFQTSYLAAYEAGEVPAINYDRMEEIDWDSVVEWSMQALSISVGSLPELPSHHRSLDRHYVVDQNPTFLGKDRARFAKDNISQLQRSELLHDLPFQQLYPSSKDALVALSLTDSNADLLNRWRTFTISALAADDSQLYDMVMQADPALAFMLAKSAVRADVFTPKAVYQPALAQDLLAKFPQHLIRDANMELDTARVITRKDREASNTRKPDSVRPAAINAYFENALKGFCYVEPADLEKAAAFKAKLDRAFQGGSKSVPFMFEASDGASLATTNLNAQGRVNMVPYLPPFDDSIGAPLPHISKWGWQAGDYKGSKTDHMSMEMVKLEIEPAATYEYGVPESLRTGAKFPAPPPIPEAVGELRLLPLWVDIHGGLMLGWWRQLVCYIVQNVHFRPCISAEELTETFKGLLWQWEVELVLGWAETNGFVVGTDEVDDNGKIVGKSWRAGEYWWLCLAKDGQLA